MAAVVGVIANLFTWFALHLFFNKITTFDLNVAQITVPSFTSLDIRVTAIAIICGWLALYRRVVFCGFSELPAWQASYPA